MTELSVAHAIARAAKELGQLRDALKHLQAQTQMELDALLPSVFLREGA